MNIEHLIPERPHTIHIIDPLGDYRAVIEYGGSFQIQKKRVTQKTIGMLWWKKIIEEITWEVKYHYHK